MSEERGTTKPFELFGAQWIDGYKLAKELNGFSFQALASEKHGSLQPSPNTRGSSVVERKYM